MEPHFSEPALIKLASGFEAATRIRAHHLPTFADTVPARHIEGTSDIITSLEYQRLLRKASEYVRTYNTLLLAYLRDHPNT